MAKKKKPARSSQAKSKGNKGGKAAKGAAGVLKTNDIVAEGLGMEVPIAICPATPTRP